ncbi:amidophosphoribosyltransferase [bacterium]|nr:amidophosphoribosyltransferase [bacterium]
MSCPGGCEGPKFCPHERTWRDACGVFGVWGPGEDVARLTFFGLYALQHRGQESAGIAVGDGHELRMHVGLGLASQVFDEEIISHLQGHVAVGHVRYSTTGGNVLANAQPMRGEHKTGPFALAHNGNLTNTVELRREMERQGVEFHGSSDTEVITKLISRSSADTLEGAVAEAMQQMEGAYSLTICSANRLLATRDPYGVRPLCIGRTDGLWILASETCALNTLSADYVREVQPGEIVTISDDGLDSMQAVESERNACCIFEFIYFARPDSHIYGRSVYMARLRMGHMLAQQAPADADLVVGVPESAIPHAMGFAQVAGIPYGEGFIKNRYIHRTFIMPDQRLREAGVKMKLTPLREAVAGKRLVVVDDSIVRGTTTGPEIALLREAGAREIHLRISCPPIRYPCFYGIDTSTRSHLIASRLSVEQIRQHVGADSLEYLDMKNLIRAVGLPKLNFCTACFDERYPIPVPKDVRVAKFDLEEKVEA